MAERFFERFVFAAFGMTSQEHGYSLSSFLVRMLKHRFEVLDADLFEVYYSGEASPETLSDEQIHFRRFNYDQERQNHKPDTALLLDAVRSGAANQLIESSGEHKKIAALLSSQRGPDRILCLHELTEDPMIRAQVLQIIELYGNQIGLFDSFERDQLTGLLNRQTFALQYNLFNSFARQNPAQNLFLAVFDIDHFKRVNDQFGHLYGDEVLLHFAQIMEKQFRYTDSLFRFGGEEFLVLFCSDQINAAERVLNRFRQAIAEFDFPGVGHVTVSIGFTHYPVGRLSADVIDEADQALYYAKEHGRNQVIDYAGIASPRDRSGSDDIELF